MKTYEFDARMFASITIQAQDETEARKALAAMLSRAALYLRAGVVVPVAVEGRADLIEVSDAPEAGA